jgi:hypothetical protein
MKRKPEKRLSRRALVALTTLISGLGLPFTGLANHVLQSSSLHGPRHSWMAAHDVLGIVFTVSAIWHIILNHKALADHIRGSAKPAAGVSREAFWAAALVGIMLLGALGHTLSPH